MVAQPTVPLTPSQPANGGGAEAAPSRPRMSTRNRLLFFLTAWLLVLMPFLFWWSTWFGRPLSSTEMGDYLRDVDRPRHIQHAIVQLGQQNLWVYDIARDTMTQVTTGAELKWYPVWTPDGEFLAYHTGSRLAWIRLFIWNSAHLTEFSWLCASQASKKFTRSPARLSRNRRSPGSCPPDLPR